MQQLKGKKVDASLDEEHKLTEIFVMLPLDIISVGEVLEGGPTSTDWIGLTRRAGRDDELTVTLLHLVLACSVC